MNLSDMHSVVIHFFYGRHELEPLHEFEELLRQAIEENEVGIYDGHEIAMNATDGCLFMYGKNAESLFKVVKPVLEECVFMKGAVAYLRFGPSGHESPEIEIEL